MVQIMAWQSPGRRQAIIWINAGILLIVPLGTYLSEISVSKDPIDNKFALL